MPDASSDRPAAEPTLKAMLALVEGCRLRFPVSGEAISTSGGAADRDRLWEAIAQRLREGAADREDAERWRWVRAHGKATCSEDDNGRVYLNLRDTAPDDLAAQMGEDVVTGADLDRLLDAARAAAGRPAEED